MLLLLELIINFLILGNFAWITVLVGNEICNVGLIEIIKGISKNSIVEYNPSPLFFCLTLLLSSMGKLVNTMMGKRYILIDLLLHASSAVVSAILLMIIESNFNCSEINEMLSRLMFIYQLVSSCVMILINTMTNDN